MRHKWGLAFNKYDLYSWANQTQFANNVLLIPYRLHFIPVMRHGIHESL